MPSLKHKFQSAIPDGVSTGVVRPSNWNDEHSLQLASGYMLGRVSVSYGDAEELSPAQIRTLINVADGSTANSTDAFLLSRANHTGTQLASTISNFATAAGVVHSVSSGANISINNTDPWNPVVSLSTSISGIAAFSMTGSFTLNQNAAALPAGPAGTVAQIGGADGVSTRALVDAFAAGANFNVRRANGTAAARSALAAGDAIGTLGAFGAYDATNYTTSSRGYLQFLAAENWTSGAQGTYVALGVTPAGTNASRTHTTFNSDGSLTINQNAAALPTPPSGTTIQVGGADGTVVSAFLDAFGAGTIAPSWASRHTRGTAAAPTAIQTDDQIFNVAGYGRGATAYSTGARAIFLAAAAENWTDAAQGAYAKVFTTPIGGIAPKAVATFGADGSLTINQNTSALPAPPSNTTVQFGGADTTTGRVVIDSFGAGANLTFRSAVGTLASRSALTAGWTIGSMVGFGSYDATNFTTTARASINIVANENWTSGANGTYISVATTPNGSVTSRTVAQFENSGALTLPVNGIAANGPTTTAATLSTGGVQNVVASGAEIVLPVGSGLLLIVDATSGFVGLVLCGGGTVAVIAGSNAQFVNSSTPTTAQIGIYSSSGYHIKNGFAASHTLGVMWLTARPAN